MFAFVGCSAIETIASLSFWHPEPARQRNRANAQANNCGIWRVQSMIMMNSLPEKIGERPNHSGWRGVKMAME
jgi:hypothetical protein